MLFRAGAPRKAARIWAGAMRFCTDRRGIAAIEFAFIAPILLVMYFATMEVSQAIEASKKVSRVGAMVADLVTQQDSITKEQLDAIMDISQTTLQPYNRSRPTITITAIEISNDSALKATVVWSRKLSNGVYSAGAAKNTTTTVPAAMKTAGAFLIRVESGLEYKPMITWAASGKETLGLVSSFDNISMGETYYPHNRMSAKILCGNC